LRLSSPDLIFNITDKGQESPDQSHPDRPKYQYEGMMLDSFCKKFLYLTHFSNEVVSSKPPIALNCCHLIYNLKQTKDQNCPELARKKYMLLIVITKKKNVYRDLSFFSYVER